MRRTDVPPEFLLTAADHEAVRQGYYFDPEAAAKVCDFFEGYLKLTLGRWVGKPFLLQSWQRSWLSMLYGWKRPDGLRRFTEAYLEVAKKNSKSTMLAGIALYSLIDEPGPEVYCGARNANQSGIIFREVGRMITASKRLRKRFKINKSKNTVVWDANNARLKMLTADVESFDGANASTVILDEVHRFAQRDLYDLAKYAGVARDQPLLISITTAGFDRHSLCWELHQEAQAILDGSTENLSLFPTIYAASQADNLDDPATWRKANPSMGVIIREADFAREWGEAKRIPSRLNIFKRLRLGIWTESDTSWLPMDLWDGAAAPQIDAWWAGREVYLGLDLSSVRDLTAATLIALDGGVAHWRSLYFVPKGRAEERARRDKVPYPQWITEGYMIAGEAPSTDEDAIIAKILELREQGVRIKAIGVDPYLSNHIFNALKAANFKVFKVQQTFGNMSPPCKELERRLLDGKLAHDGSPVTRWNMANTVVETDAMGNIRPNKKKSTEKIDGTVAGVIALGLATCVQPATPGFFVD